MRGKEIEREGKEKYCKWREKKEIYINFRQNEIKREENERIKERKKYRVKKERYCKQREEKEIYMK